MPHKSTTKRIIKKPPVKSKTGGFCVVFGLISLRRYKTHTTVTFNPKRFKRELRRELLRKRRTWLKVFKSHRKSLNNALTTLLFLISMIGLGVTIKPYIHAYALSKDAPTQTKATNKQRPSPNPPKTTGLAYSVPTQLTIPLIGLSTSLTRTGQNADGSLHVPDDGSVAGWYEASPTPGQVGPAVITGHLDTLSGPAVFANVSQLKVGDDIQVTRTDGKIVEYTVDSTAEYSQDSFPAETVYANTAVVSLRLITCGGAYNFVTGHYTSNIVIYASKK